MLTDLVVDLGEETAFLRDPMVDEKRLDAVSIVQYKWSTVSPDGIALDRAARTPYCAGPTSTSDAQRDCAEPRVDAILASAACEVAFHRAVNDRYRHLAVSAPPAALKAAPGQFFQLLCPGQGEGTHLLRRPMSVYRVDREARRIEFLYKVTGVGTRGLAGLQPGERLEIFGPLGHGFRLDPSWRHVVLLGRGVGLATLAPLAEAARSQGMRVTAVLSVVRAEYAMSVERLRDSGARVVVVTDEDGSAEPAQVEARLRRLVENEGCDLIATCGSNRLLQLVRRLGRELGIAGQVALEQQMACGIGMCHCCVRLFRGANDIEPRRVCHDGPVFDVQETLSW